MYNPSGQEPTEIGFVREGTPVVGSPYTVRAILSAVRRRRMAALTAFLVVMLLAGIYIVMMPAKYEAEMRLFITRSRVDLPISPGGGTVGTVPGDVTDGEVNSELELLKSTDLLENVARSCGLLKAGGDSRQAALVLKNMQRDLKVMPVKKTNIISVKYSSRDPLLSQRVVNTMADLYLEKHTAIHRNRETSEFFAEKSKQYGTQLEEAQRNLAAFEQSKGASMLDQQKDASLKRRADLQTSLNDVRSQMREAEDRAKTLRAQLKALPSTVNSENRSARNESLIEKLKTMQLQLENRRTELLTKYDPGYRLVQEVDQQIRDTRAALDRELAPRVVDKVDALNPLRQTVEAELLRTETLAAGLRAKEQSMAANLQTEIGNQSNLVRATTGDEDLKRRQKIAEENYLLYRRKQEESRIAEEMDKQRILNVSVMQMASVPVLPVDRHRSFIVLLALLAGALLSMVTALAVDSMDQPVRTSRQAETAARVPVLARFVRGGA
ncbi:MAG: Wzz/FepE/Etk N-terminal domain-containing protein [Acidobacteriota bacterium]|nr:Wzz/FepE/Etk N-terminal domain-containing protein [Acidobacteriota bacterium]